MSHAWVMYGWTCHARNMQQVMVQLIDDCLHVPRAQQTVKLMTAGRLAVCTSWQVDMRMVYQPHIYILPIHVFQP